MEKEVKDEKPKKITQKKRGSVQLQRLQFNKPKKFTGRRFRKSFTEPASKKDVLVKMEEDIKKEVVLKEDSKRICYKIFFIK